MKKQYLIPKQELKVLIFWASIERFRKVCY